MFVFQTDYDPRLEAFWKVGNFYPDNETYEKRKEELEKQRDEKKKKILKTKDPKEIIPEEYVEHWIQYFGEPCIQLRHILPLSPLVHAPLKIIDSEKTLDKGETVEKEEIVDNTKQDLVLPVPKHRYDPGYYGFQQEKRHGTNIPGKR